MSLAACNSNQMAPVFKSVPYRHDIWICGLVQHCEWHGCLADLAPPWVEATAAVALISFAFGGGAQSGRDLRALAKRKGRTTICGKIGPLGVFDGGRQGAPRLLPAV